MKVKMEVEKTNRLSLLDTKSLYDFILNLAVRRILKQLRVQRKSAGYES